MVIAKRGTAVRYYAKDEVNQKEGKQNKVDGMKKVR